MWKKFWYELLDVEGFSEHPEQQTSRDEFCAQWYAQSQHYGSEFDNEQPS